MQHVLVHIDRDLGPIGAWSYHDHRLRHFYPQSLDLAISGRARQLMAERTDVSVPDWFLYLTTLAGLADDYQFAEADDNSTLVEIISEYRRVWNTTV